MYPYSSLHPQVEWMNLRHHPCCLTPTLKTRSYVCPTRPPALRLGVDEKRAINDQCPGSNSRGWA